jgi:hypothetical protein
MSRDDTALVCPRRNDFTPIGALFARLIKRTAAVVICVSAFAPSVFANAITDWDEKAVSILATQTPYEGQRVMAMLHVAMFDAVNSIERRWRPYVAQVPAAPTTSKEAAAASAATSILAASGPKAATEAKAALAAYLASIPDDHAKSEGMALGEAVAAKVLEARAHDGSDALDDYRPRTTAGVYIPTALAAGSICANWKPFVLATPSQFRPVAPVALNSAEWAAD